MRKLKEGILTLDDDCERKRALQGSLCTSGFWGKCASEHENAFYFGASIVSGQEKVSNHFRFAHWS